MKFSTNKNCEKIHLFKRLNIDGKIDIKKEFLTLNYALSRVFDSDDLARKKVIPFINSKEFPSIK
jgi:hypothetical protein